MRFTRRRGFTQDMRIEKRFFQNLGIAVSTSRCQQIPSFRDTGVFPPLEADKDHGLLLAAVSLNTRVSKESPKARFLANTLTAPADLSNQGGRTAMNETESIEELDDGLAIES